MLIGCGWGLGIRCCDRFGASGGEVVVGENRLTGISYAIKTVVKGANKKAQERSKTEVALMQKISHPHICKLMSVYEHPQKYHVRNSKMIIVQLCLTQ